MPQPKTQFITVEESKSPPRGVFNIKAGQVNIGTIEWSVHHGQHAFRTPAYQTLVTSHQLSEIVEVVQYLNTH